MFPRVGTRHAKCVRYGRSFRFYACAESAVRRDTQRLVPIRARSRIVTQARVGISSQLKQRCIRGGTRERAIDFAESPRSLTLSQVQLGKLLLRSDIFRLFGNDLLILIDGSSFLPSIGQRSRISDAGRKEIRRSVNVCQPKSICLTEFAARGQRKREIVPRVEILRIVGQRFLKKRKARL